MRGRKGETWRVSSFYREPKPQRLIFQDLEGELLGPDTDDEGESGTNDYSGFPPEGRTRSSVESGTCVLSNKAHACVFRGYPWGLTRVGQLGHRRAELGVADRSGGRRRGRQHYQAWRARILSALVRMPVLIPSERFVQNFPRGKRKYRGPKRRDLESHCTLG